jgi:hypothetical protein
VSMPMCHVTRTSLRIGRGVKLVDPPARFRNCTDHSDKCFILKIQETGSHEQNKFNYARHCLTDGTFMHKQSVARTLKCPVHSGVFCTC